MVIQTPKTKTESVRIESQLSNYQQSFRSQIKNKTESNTKETRLYCICEETESEKEEKD